MWILQGPQPVAGLRGKLYQLQDKLSEEGVSIEFTKAFEDWMVEGGYDPAYGARPIKRLMQRELVNQLAKEILAGKVHKDSTIEVDAAAGSIVLRDKAKA